MPNGCSHRRGSNVAYYSRAKNEDFETSYEYVTSVSQPQSETIEHKSPVSVAADPVSISMEADPVSISMEADPVSIRPKSKGKSKRNKKKPKKKRNKKKPKKKRNKSKKKKEEAQKKRTEDDQNSNSLSNDDRKLLTRRKVDLNKIEDDLKAFEEEVEFEVNKFYHYGRCVLIMHKKICDGGLKKWKKWEVKDSAKDYKKMVRKFMKSKEVDEIDKFEKAPEDA